ncbi:MAG: imidazoleglycerol-phosphate dehydratase HisB [Clostridia bacterium]|nr:imidazoleglycerol-phosphate dehydratase HisB [Clostridia bacterium]
MKEAFIERNTKETEIKMTLRTGCGAGALKGSTGIGFFDHMLNSFCVHGSFEIELDMKGDLFVDSHHTVEDVGIVLGKLFAEIAGDKKGIARFGQSYVPMDESLALAVVDFCGRPYLVFNAEFSSPIVGSYDTQLTVEFFRALAFNMGATLHINLMYGANDHHKIEAIFKAAARSISASLCENGGAILSAKGSL